MTHAEKTMVGIGVLWSGDHVFPGTVETLEMLRNKGIMILAISAESLKGIMLTRAYRETGRLRHE